MVGMSLAAGATIEEVTEVLLIVAPMVGAARTVAAAPRIVAALGLDIEAAIEELEPSG
jgi:alkylhydroperoxidase/carboxymuconolactone decarboxylase family protein YurZ